MMSKLVRATLFIFFCFYTITCFGQKSNTEISLSKDSIHRNITARYHYGLILPHHPSLVYFIEDLITSAELSYGVINYNDDSWYKYYNYPEVGVGLYYTTLGNNDIYGRAYALFPYINFTIYSAPKFSARYKVALGLGYTDLHFDPIENPKDLIVSSAFNAYVGLGLLTDYRVTKELSLSATVSFNHFSNGASKKPNYGANLLSGSLGIKYHFNDQLNPIKQRYIAPKIKKQELFIIAGMAKNQIYPDEQDKHWSGTVSLNYLWHHTAKRAWGIGGDLMYFDGAPLYYIADNTTLEEYSNIDNMYAGITGSYNLIISRVTMVMQLGVYVFYKTKPQQPIYPRLGIRYRISDRLLANFTVKASFFRSEYLEFGLGYRLHNKN